MEITINTTPAKVQNNWKTWQRNVIVAVWALVSGAATFGIAALALPADLAKQDYWLGVGIALVVIIGLFTLLYFPIHFHFNFAKKSSWVPYIVGVAIVIASVAGALWLTNVPTAFKVPWPLLNGVWSALIAVAIVGVSFLTNWGSSRFKKI